MKKSNYLIIFYVFLYFFYLFLIAIPFYIYAFFGDYGVYYEAYVKFWNNERFYWDHLNYLPSFFFLSIFLVDGFIFAMFLVICSIICFILLLKLEDNYFAVFLFSIILFTLVISGNIEPFVFLITLLCCIYKYNKYLPPILLAFVCFKLNVIFIVPFFLYWSENRKYFIFTFSASFILFNLYFLFNINQILNFLLYGFSTLNPNNLFLRLTLIYTIYHFVILWEKEKLEEEKKRKIERFLDKSEPP